MTGKLDPPEPLIIAASKATAEEQAELLGEYGQPAPSNGEVTHKKVDRLDGCYGPDIKVDTSSAEFTLEMHENIKWFSLGVKAEQARQAESDLDDVNVCKGCSTVKHVNAKGLCGKCSPSGPMTTEECGSWRHWFAWSIGIGRSYPYAFWVATKYRIKTYHRKVRSKRTKVDLHSA
jgi:hypothetical protein